MGDSVVVEVSACLLVSFACCPFLPFLVTLAHIFEGMGAVGRATEVAGFPRWELFLCFCFVVVVTVVVIAVLVGLCWSQNFFVEGAVDRIDFSDQYST